MRIGNNIRFFRDKKGWSQEVLAHEVSEALGRHIGQDAISLYESNKRDLQWEIIEAIAKALDCPTDELTRQEGMYCHNLNQQGGVGGVVGTYVVQNDAAALLAAKDTIIEAKDAIIAAKEQTIQALLAQLEQNKT